MKFMSSLIVVVALVGSQTVAEDFEANYEQAQLQLDGSLVAHPKLAQTVSTEDLKANLKAMDMYDGKREGTPLSEMVAQLLYTAEDKSAEVLNGLTVDELIAANTFHSLADCSERALSKQAYIYYKSMPSRHGLAAAPPGAVFYYALKCTMLAANYCLTHRKEVVEAEVATDKFMDSLQQNYLGSVEAHKSLCGKYKIACNI